MKATLILALTIVLLVGAEQTVTAQTLTQDSTVLHPATFMLARSPFFNGSATFKHTHTASAARIDTLRIPDLASTDVVSITRQSANSLSALHVGKHSVAVGLITIPATVPNKKGGTTQIALSLTWALPDTATYSIRIDKARQ